MIQAQELAGLLLQLLPSEVAPIILVAAIAGALALLKEIAEFSPRLLVHAEAFGNRIDLTDVVLPAHANNLSGQLAVGFTVHYPTAFRRCLGQLRTCAYAPYSSPYLPRRY